MRGRWLARLGWRALRVGVLTRSPDHVSLEIYRAQIVRHLAALGVDAVPFDEAGPLPPDVDVLWDPALGMRPVPPILFDARRPVVVDVVGLRTFGLAVESLYADPARQEAEAGLRARVLADWSTWSGRAAAVIVPSDFMARETARALGVSPDRIHRSYPGVEREVFRVDGHRLVEEPYFLHVSSGDGHRKNTARILAAYARLPVDRRPALVLKALGVREEIGIPGVRIVPDHVDEHQLACWYRGALALLFPSLYEGFGLPIVEAMACGCPVLTASTTACGEVGGDAVLKVDPWSEDAIFAGMRRLMDDPGLRRRLRALGLARATHFEWARTARQHRDVFRAVRRSS